LLTETVNAYSSQGSSALQVGVPLACEDGFGTRYGPPVNVSGPLVSVSVLPLVGVVGAIALAAAKGEAGTGIASEPGPNTKAARLADKQSSRIKAVLYRTITETKRMYDGFNICLSPLRLELFIESDSFADEALACLLTSSGNPAFRSEPGRISLCLAPGARWLLQLDEL